MKEWTTRSRARSLLRTAFGSTLLCGLGVGQVREGELLLNTFMGYSDGLFHYRPDGTLVASATSGSGTGWTGAAIDASGNWITAYRQPMRGIAVFDPSGIEIATFPVPQVASPTGDVELFSDGTLAVADQSGKVELYSPAGSHLGTFASGLSQPYGLAVDAFEDLWVCDVGANVIWHFARDGSLLGSIDAAPNDVADVDVAPDGSLWAIADFGAVRHYARDGTLLSSFQQYQNFPSSCGIALAPDGTLWVSSFHVAAIRHYDTSGAFLGEFPTATLGATFLTIPGGIQAVRYCSPSLPNSSGRPAHISALGSQRVSANDVTLVAGDLPPLEFGYFLVGSSPGRFMPPGSQGIICIAGGALGRFIQAGQIIQGPGGSIVVDLTVLPLTPAHSVQPGETWNFQCWFRDLASNNFTDAVGVTFR